MVRSYGTDKWSGFRMCPPVPWQPSSQNGSISLPLECDWTKWLASNEWNVTVWRCVSSRTRSWKGLGIVLSPSFCLAAFPPLSFPLPGITYCGEASCHVCGHSSSPVAESGVRTCGLSPTAMWVNCFGGHLSTPGKPSDGGSPAWLPACCLTGAPGPEPSRFLTLGAVWDNDVYRLELLSFEGIGFTAGDHTLWHLALRMSLLIREVWGCAKQCPQVDGSLSELQGLLLPLAPPTPHLSPAFLGPLSSLARPLHPQRLILCLWQKPSPLFIYLFLFWNRHRSYWEYNGEYSFNT